MASAAPKTLVDALKLYHDESRGIDYLLLTNANIEPIKTPADDVLAKWFDGVKQRFRAPEYPQDRIRQAAVRGYR